MTFRLVALDLDGTLLSRDQTISPRNLATLRYLAANGVHICIATGRMRATAEAATQALDFPHSLAAYNGALVLDQPSGTVRVHDYLQPADVVRILRFFAARDLTGRLDVMTDALWYVRPLADERKAEALRLGIDVTSVPEGEWAGAEAAKVMITTPRDRSGIILDEIRLELPDLHAVFSTATLLEVMAGGVSKGRAVLRLADELGIPAAEVVAFGDQANDVDMLQSVGCGVAMGNAIDAVKAAADQVTLSHMEDGVAVGLERLFGLEQDRLSAS